MPLWAWNLAEVSLSKYVIFCFCFQTVVCFPLLGGVIELGTTDLVLFVSNVKILHSWSIQKFILFDVNCSVQFLFLKVLEDYALIQHIKMSISDISDPIASKKSDCRARNTRNDQGFVCDVVDHALLNTNSIPVVVRGELNMASPSNSSNGLEPDQPANDSLMVERINGAASQVQSWQIVDDELSNCVHQSMDSSDCISQTLVNAEKVGSGPKHETLEDHPLQYLLEYNHMKISSLDPQSEDLHYQGVLSTLLKSSHQLILGPHFQKFRQESSFVSWKKGALVKKLKTSGGTPQKLLKKVLFEVPRMHLNCVIDSPEDDSIGNEVWRPEADEIGVNHAISEGRRRERLNENFSILKTMVPSLSKVSITLSETLSQRH